MNHKYKHLRGKRLAALDYGRKRAGFAVCDEFHITVSPRKVLDFSSPDFFNNLREEIEKENASALVLGIPLRSDNEETEIIKEIRRLKKDIEEKIGLEVILHDEAFSTVRASETMLSIGKKKKQRARKGSKDLIAAAIILRDFLQSIE